MPLRSSVSSKSEQRLSETVTPFLGKEKPLLHTSSKK